MIIILCVIVLTILFFVIGLIGTASVKTDNEKIDGTALLIMAFVVAIISVLIAVVTK